MPLFSELVMNMQLFQKDKQSERVETNGERPDSDDSSSQDVDTVLILLGMVVKILEKHKE